ncbi:hypothetical protein Tco_0965707 [Tanacetum coccineum]
MAIPEDHLAKFHKMTDAKEMWEAIKSRFGGNDESKKMQKYIFKQKFESFSLSNTEGFHKGYDKETVKERNTCSPSPTVNKRDWNGLMSKKLGLGYGFTKKACFVYGSFSHLIRDCDFHEKRMAKQVELNKKKGKGTGQGDNRPIWNNVQRLNHQNKFVPKPVLTKTGIFLVNTARQNLFSQTTATSTTRKINTARPIKSEGSEGFHRIIDFLNSSHIRYALIENPTIYVSFIKQFWSIATARTSATGEVELTATIDGQENTITEASLRRHLKLEDSGGVTTLPNSEIFEQLALIWV